MEVEWSDDRIAHLATRSSRYGPAAADLVPVWANEAVNDPQAITEPIDPARPHLRVTTGRSDGYGDLLTVVYLDIDGGHVGVTAYLAGRKTWLEYQKKFNA